MNYPAASCGVSKNIYENLSQSCHPRMSLSGVQSCFGSAQHDPELSRMGHSFVWISAEGRIRPKPCGGPDRSIRE